MRQTCRPKLNAENGHAAQLPRVNLLQPVIAVEVVVTPLLRRVRKQQQYDRRCATCPLAPEGAYLGRRPLAPWRKMPTGSIKLPKTLYAAVPGKGTESCRQHVTRVVIEGGRFACGMGTLDWHPEPLTRESGDVTSMEETIWPMRDDDIPNL